MSPAPTVMIRYTRIRSADEESCVPPVRSYPNDAGLDLTVSRSVVISAGAKAEIPTNLALEMPPGYWGWVVPRSSTFYIRGLEVHLGVIDEGYRGEIKILVRNPTDRKVTVQAGERLAQLLVLPRYSVEVIAVKELSPGDRREHGFGSTGGFKK